MGRSASERLQEALQLRADGESAAALAVLSGAARDAPKDDVALRIRISNEQAILEMLTGSPERALTVLNWVLAEANSERLDDVLEVAPGIEWDLARSFIVFLDAGLRLPDVHASKLLDAVEAGHRYLARIGREEWRDGLLNMHAKLVRDMGQLDEAIELLREAVEVARSLSSESPGLTVASNLRGLGELLRDLERFDEAREVLQEILHDKRSSKLDRLGAHVTLGHIANQLDEPRRAILHGGRALELAAGMFPKQRAIVLGLLVDAYRGVDDTARAEASAVQGLRLARSTEVPSLVCGALQDMVDVHLDAHELDEAAELLSEAEEIATRVDARTDRSIYADRLAQRRDRLDSMTARETDAE